MKYRDPSEPIYCSNCKHMPVCKYVDNIIRYEQEFKVLSTVSDGKQPFLTIACAYRDLRPQNEDQ